MKKVEIKYSNGTKSIVKAYEKYELENYLKYNNKTIDSLLLINIDNVDLYFEKDNIIFENCTYEDFNDTKLYDNLINDKQILSSLKLNKLFINISGILTNISVFMSAVFLFIMLAAMSKGFPFNIFFKIFLSNVISITTFGILFYLYSTKNNKILNNFLKDVTVEEMNIYNEQENNSNTIENDLKNIKKFNYKEKLKYENEIIFQINEKMKDKLLYK